MKYLHTMIRVGDLEKSINFYTQVIGLKHHSTTEYADGEFSLAFLGYGGDNDEGKDGPRKGSHPETAEPEKRGLNGHNGRASNFARAPLSRKGIILHLVMAAGARCR